MSSELMLWGCAQVPIIEHPRALAYASRLGPWWMQPHCGSDAGVLGALGNPVYTAPESDSAWWYDPLRPESRLFYGYQVMGGGVPIGADQSWSSSVQSSVTEACGGDIVHGARAYTGHRIEWTVRLNAGSCCAAAYGLKALRRALDGCGCQSCRGGPMRVWQCTPQTVRRGDGVTITETVSGWRTYRKAKVTVPPYVVSGGWDGCGQCGCGARDTIVKFEIVTAPGSLLDPVTVLAPIAWAPTSTCQLNCPTVSTVSNRWYDPACTPKTIVAPSPAPGCYCPPIIVDKMCFDVTTTGLSDLFAAELIPTIVNTGPELTGLAVQIWAKNPSFPAGHSYYTDDTACANFALAKVPGQSTVTRDICQNGWYALVGGRNLSIEHLISAASGGASPGCIQIGCGDYVACISLDGLANAAITPNFTLAFQGSEIEP